VREGDKDSENRPSSTFWGTSGSSVKSKSVAVCRAKASASSRMPLTLPCMASLSTLLAAAAAPASSDASASSDVTRHDRARTCFRQSDGSTSDTSSDVLAVSRAISTPRPHAALLRPASASEAVHHHFVSWHARAYAAYLSAGKSSLYIHSALHTHS